MDSIQTGTLKRALRDNEGMRHEMQQFELTIYQLREKTAELEEKLEKMEAERDSLLIAQNPNDESSGPDGIRVHPVILKHINTIAFLKTKLQEAEARTLNALGAARPATAASLLSRQSVVSAAMRASTSRLNEYDSKISDTIEKAKQEIRLELKSLQNRARRTPLPKKGSRPSSAIAGQMSTVSDKRTALRPRTGIRQEHDDNSDDTDADEDDEEEVLGSEPGGPLGGEQTSRQAGAEDQMMIVLEQIQSDIAIKEELVLQLEKTQTGYQAMKEKYEEKLKQLQDNLLALQHERDLALKKTDGGAEESEKVGVG